MDFDDAIEGLLRGDFSRLHPLFEDGSIIAWCEAGRFRDHPIALSEALSCACFNGCIPVAEYLLNHGVDPSGGSGTGMNAIHWAANRGQLEAVRLLLRHSVPLETRSMYGGTVLGTARWSARNEPKPAHAQIIEELLKAGARPEDD